VTISLRSRRLQSAAAIAALCFVAACSSSNNAASTNTSPTTTGSAQAAASGSPILVMDEGTFAGSNNPSFGNTPEIESAVNSYFEGLDKSGGISGRQVKVITCNDQANPNLAANCAREAVSDHVIAMIATDHAGNGPTMLPILQQGKVALIESIPLTSPDYTNPVAFVVGSGTAPFGAVAIALVKSGCKKIGAFDYNVASSQAIVDQMRAAIKPLGATIGDVTVNPSASTFAGTVSTLQSGGYDCMIPVVVPTQLVPLMEAVTAAGVKIKWGQVDEDFTSADFKAMSQAGANGGLVSTQWYPQDSSSPAMKQLNADFTANNVPFEETTVDAWTDSEVVALVAKSITGDLTSSSFLAAMNSVHGLNLGTTGVPYQTQTPVAKTVYNRLFNPDAYVDVLENGKLVQQSPTPIDAAATFTSA
jgi:ABC-type branched-subunit amino acid transport system substrate-binding protein